MLSKRKLMMSGRIVFETFRSVHTKINPIQNMRGSFRFFSEQVAMKVDSLRRVIPSTKYLKTKEVNFIGSESLRKSTLKEIEANQTLKHELAESYKMMEQDPESNRAANFCTNVMRNRDG